VGRAAGEFTQKLQRPLAFGLRDRRTYEPDGCGTRSLCAQADTAQAHAVRLAAKGQALTSASQDLRAIVDIEQQIRELMSDISARSGAL
jgi:hypothetical protein